MQIIFDLVILKMDYVVKTARGYKITTWHNPKMYLFIF